MSKYIIDVGDAYVRHALGRKLIIPVIINNDTEYWVNTNIQLTPYTEPDTEKVREEVLEAIREEVLEAVSRIYDIPQDDRGGIFPKATYYVSDIVRKYSASEIIEKIRQYEREQEEIKAGDVVRMKNAPEIEIWVTDISDEDGGLLSGLALKTVGDNCDIGDTYANRNIYNFERTGKHYDVPTVLENMRGGQDG